MRGPLPATLLLLLLPTPLLGHDFTITDTLVVLKRNGQFQVEMTCDLDALLLGIGPGHPPQEVVDRIRALDDEERERRLDRLRSLFERRVRVRFDGEPAPFVVTFPDATELPPQPSAPPTVFGVTARLTGMVPEVADSFTFFASRSFSAVQLTIVKQDRERLERQILAVGDTSEPYPLLAAAVDEEAAESGVGSSYLWLGFRHILPGGLDHVLFVLGLYLLSARWRPLLIQVTAFTLAHTLTLALSMYGVVSLPSRLVEPLIAFSIVYVAVENVWRHEVGPWRVAVVFTFGLLHGLGFAGVLAELGLPRGSFVTALVAFNVGVELGQLAVLALALLLLGWARQREDYRRRVVVPLSCLLALVGLIFAVERLL